MWGVDDVCMERWGPDRDMGVEPPIPLAIRALHSTPCVLNEFDETRI